MQITKLTHPYRTDCRPMDKNNQRSALMIVRDVVLVLQPNPFRFQSFRKSIRDPSQKIHYPPEDLLKLLAGPYILILVMLKILLSESLHLNRVLMG